MSSTGYGCKPRSDCANRIPSGPIPIRNRPRTQFRSLLRKIGTGLQTICRDSCTNTARELSDIRKRARDCMPAHKRRQAERAESRHPSRRPAQPAAASISNCRLIALFYAGAGLRPSHLVADCNKRRRETMSRKCSCPYSPARKEMRKAPSRWDPNFADLQLAPTRCPSNPDALGPSGLLPRSVPEKWLRTKSAPRANPGKARSARLVDPPGPAIEACRQASRRPPREPDLAVDPGLFDPDCPGQPVHFAARWQRACRLPAKTRASAETISASRNLGKILNFYGTRNARADMLRPS